MISRIISRWGTPYRPALSGLLWMACLLGVLVWLDGLHDGLFLVPPFAATMTILIYLPAVSIAQPYAIIAGSTAGALIGTALTLIFGFGPEIAMGAALVAVIALPLLRAYHPPGIALAMYPALLHPGIAFAPRVVLPFTMLAVISASAMSRLVRGWPRYPAAL
jgi:CBS domain-containing membrane protein